jgi:anti-sigma regulatory factor (Ser/Thr protein kinase)
MATVEVEFTPLPAHVRTARLVATAVARRSGVDEALLDEVRLAVGEACSRAVEGGAPPRGAPPPPTAGTARPNRSRSR